LIFSALFHDYGKIYNRFPTGKGGRVRFTDHALVSTQFSIDATVRMINYMYPEMPLEDVSKILYYVSFVSSRHQNFYDTKLNNEEDIKKFFNNDASLYEIMKRFELADRYGRFSEIGIEASENFGCVVKSEKWKIVPLEEIERVCRLAIISGIPGSGKDFIAKNVVECKGKRHILSWDDIRIEKYKEKHDPKEYEKLSDKEIYSKAFEWCNKKNISVNCHLEEKLKKIKEEGLGFDDVIIVCNTSLTESNRTAVLKLFKNIFPKEKVVSIYCCLFGYGERSVKPLLKRSNF
jgi:hypothetical protein